MPARLSAADRTGRTVRCGRPRCPQDLVAGPRGQRAVPQEPSPALHTTCNPKSVYVCTRQCLPYEVRNHGADSNAPLLRQYCAPGPAKCPAWSSAWWRMLDGRRRSACCQQNGALPGLYTNLEPDTCLQLRDTLYLWTHISGSHPGRSSFLKREGGTQWESRGTGRDLMS